MPEHTQCIVLDTFKFKETSVIARVYTQEFGLISAMINGVRNKNAKSSQVYLQPLSQIEVLLYHKEQASLHRMTNINLVQSPLGIVPDIKRFSLAMFLSEVVLKTWKEHQPDIRLFNLLSHVIHGLNSFPDFQDLHLFFLAAYSDILGISLKAAEPDFEILAQQESGLHSNLLVLSQMEEYESLGITKKQRMEIVRWILHFYSQHLECPTIQSLTILEEVFA